jgi:hypothetical protein
MPSKSEVSVESHDSIHDDRSVHIDNFLDQFETAAPTAVAGSSAVEQTIIVDVPVPSRQKEVSFKGLGEEVSTVPRGNNPFSGEEVEESRYLIGGQQRTIHADVHCDAYPVEVIHRRNRTITALILSYFLVPFKMR